MKRDGSKENLRGRVVALTGALAFGLSPAAGAGGMPVIDRNPPGRTGTATFAMG